jgi:hypothetical protein
MAWQRISYVLIIVLLAVSASGCGTDDVGNETEGDCRPGEQKNTISGECEVIDGTLLDAGNADTDSSVTDTVSNGDVDNDTSQPNDSGPADTGPDGAGPADTDGVDTNVDTGADTGDDAQSTCPDRDGDGVADEACGGQDCDDDNPNVAPGLAEVCDAHDNDCDGALNQGLQCSFYAHSSTNLYQVDPFAKTAMQVTSVPNLFDIDTHPDGTLYGVTSTSLYKYDQPDWTLVGNLGSIGTPNGLAIDNQGTAYLTSSSTLYTVDLGTGSTTTIGDMGGSFNSSGDCVVNKDNSLYMSSDHNFSADNLVLIDGNTGQASDIGSIGERNVYGLTAAWGKMFGLADSGELIEINPGSGQGTVVHTFPQISWYGAASTPQR